MNPVKLTLKNLLKTEKGKEFIFSDINPNAEGQALRLIHITELIL